MGRDAGCKRRTSLRAPTLQVADRRSFVHHGYAQRGGGLPGMRACAWRLAGAVVIACLAGCSTTPHDGRLPLRQVSETALTGGPVRFDYTALDSERGRLFIAHMGAGELIDVDVHAHAVVRTLPDLPDVHGVIVVPEKHRVYATATGKQPVGRHRRGLR